MAIDSFKVNKSLSLNPQSTTIANPINGDLYYQEGKGFSLYKDGFWHDLTDVIDFAASASMTSFNLDDATVRNNVIKLTGTLGAAANLHGLSASAKGKIVYIYNQTNQNILLKHQSFTETIPENRIASSTGKDIKLKPNQSAQCFYDTTTNRWLVVGGVGGAEDPVVVNLINNVTNQPIPEIVFDSNETHVVDGVASIERIYTLPPTSGEVDTAFMANAVNPTDFNGEIFVTAVHPDGRIFVGGNFTSYKGQTGKDCLIALNPDGTEDTTFSANAVVSGTTPNFAVLSSPGIIRALAFQSDGKILIGGSFLNYKGQSGVSWLVRLNSNGTEDTVFTNNAVKTGSSANLNGYVTAILVQDDDKIVVGGQISSYKGDVSRYVLLRFSSSGVLDTTFNNGHSAAVNWTASAMPIVAAWERVVYAPELSLFVAQCSTSGQSIATSPDGTNWTTRSTPGSFNRRGLVWSSQLNLFASVGNDSLAVDINSFMTSPDGINWTQRAAPSLATWRDVAYGNGTFVAVASDTGSGNPKIATSPNGITWTLRASPWVANESGNAITYSPQLNLFVALASAASTPAILTSPDGITWTARTNPANYTWTGIAWSPQLGLFAATAITTASNNIMTSPDGINWTLRTTPSTNQWSRIHWSADVGLFVAVGTTGTGNRVITSPDGITWTVRNTPENNSWSSVTFGKGKFVAVSSNGTNRSMYSSVVSNFNLPAFPINTIEQVDINNIIVGGQFSYNDSINTASYLVKLSKTTGSYVAFAASPNSFVYKIKKQADGNLLIGGNFTGYLSGSNYITRMSAAGTPDLAFISNTNTKLNNAVKSIGLTSTGDMVLGGDFTDYDGFIGKSKLIKLDLAGNEIGLFSDTAVTNNINNSVNSVAITIDDSVILGGNFTSYKSTSNRFVKLLDSTPGVDVEYLTKLNFSAIYRNSTSAWEISGVTWTGDNPETTISIDGTTGTLQYSTSNLLGTEIASVMKVKSTIL